MERQECTRCLMDTTDPHIKFDSEGVCNHCLGYDQLLKTWQLPELLKSNAQPRLFSQIKKSGAGKEWDCLLGLSGGVDSSYLAYLAKQNGLRPLCVHLDNGWNSELAVSNIHKIVKKYNYELYTHVIDWEEFKDLQRSFFKADVIDLELLTDHAIFAVIMQLAHKHNIKYILSGANHSTEAIMPKAWVHPKQDKKNILAIHKCFGTRKIKSFPLMSSLQHVINMFVLGYKVAKPLNLMIYDKSAAKKTLQQEFEWRDYGGKHYESIFTKFYQAHILPTKFHVDKRRAHLSTLINSGQLNKPQAREEIQKPLYETSELEQDFSYICKKLNFSKEELNNYLSRPGKSHYDYPTESRWYIDLAKSLKIFRS